MHIYTEYIGVKDPCIIYTEYIGVKDHALFIQSI